MKAAGFELVATLPDHPTRPMVTVKLVSFSDLNWSGKIPGYVDAWVTDDEQEAVFASVAIVRLCPDQGVALRPPCGTIKDR